MNVWKTIKLFISSTFVDLELERDHLTEEFAGIKKELMERQLSFMTYDLRWRQKHEQESIVKWCIEMVDRCEYFVAILGNRYGWRPSLDAEGNPNEKNISVTEMEIVHAQKTIAKDKRFFCILQRENTSSEDAFSLRQLKKNLIEQNEDVHEFFDTGEMLRFISQKMREKIDSHYPPQQKVGTITYTPEEVMQELIAEKTLGFVGRQGFLQQINAFANSISQNNYLILHAVAGSGKSAVIAKFCQDWQKTQTTPILHYFIAISSSVRDLITSIVKQMLNYGLLTEEIKEDPFEMRTQMRSTLENTKENIILLIDAVDEIEESAKDFAWLPRNLPANVRIIISTRPVATFDVLQKYPQASIISLPPLQSSEIQEIITYYEQKHDLKTSAKDHQLLQERASGNPLYLKVALEEIVSTGVGIGQLATSIESLFEQILERLYVKYNTSLIFDYLGFIAASRNGLSEHEMRELVAAYSETEDISDDLVLVVTKSLSHFIVQRAGVMQFFHAEFQRSLKQRFGRGRMRKYHHKLATYFTTCGFTYTRSLGELCFQMQWAEMHEELLSLLTNLDFLELKTENGMIDDLVNDFQLAVQHPLIPIPTSTEANQHGIQVTSKTIHLIWRALTIDLRFVRRHPQYIFQCLWNRCYWYDTPTTKNYYEYQDHDKLPWKKNINIFSLMQKWRQKKHHQQWLEVISPIEPHLDSRLRKTFAAHQREVMSIALHQGKQRIVSVSRDRKIYVWHLETGECLAEIAEHKEHVYSVAFHPDGQKFATGDSEGFLFVWDSSSLECIQILEGHHGAVTSITFDVKRNQVISVAEDATIMIWDAKSGKRIQVLDGFQEAFFSIAISSSGEYLAGASKDGNVYLLDLEKKEIIDVLQGHERIVTDVAFSSDDTYLATSSKDNTVRIWNVKEKKCISIITHHYASVNSVRFIPDSHVVISGGEDNSLFITDIHSNEILIGWQRHTWQINSIEVSDDSCMVACGAKDGSVTLWDIHDYKTASKEQLNQVVTLRGHKKNISAIGVSLKNDCIVSGSEDTFIKLWSIAKNENAKSFYTNDVEIQCMAISQDCTKVIAGASNGTVAMFNLQTGDIIHKMKGHKGKVSRILFCNNDNNIISLGYFDNTVRLWDMLSGEYIQVFTGHERWIESIAINHDETIIATGSRDKTMKIWDMKTGKCLKTMHGHEIGVTSVAFSPEGKMIASASSHEGVVRIWQTQTGTCLSIFSPSSHQDIIEEMAFAPDGDEIACIYKSNKTSIWNIKNNEQVMHIEGRIHLKDYYNPQKEKYSVMENWQTLIVNKKDKQTVAAFPEAIFSLHMVNEKCIAGICKSNGRGVVLMKFSQ